ncbi:MAG TPA: cytochrome C assembly protein [Bacteroidales bacterium]|nr:MAG: cytochrome C assembly protein [Bacteroidetes bacterium GWF2_33_38]OFY72440.1 MAG: cytochrome C assembly protein [Bacteroidetes bacterium RIFOXYA12_FULL_33_9]OFY88981.1 MAG: cytochrome C assembly protein [Bacteroidetes bacterium RIFOXYA2_FULL_33_7]HBF88961.1 cytochrome C assembly protein [Bacteroidales bacterium]
MEVLSYKYFAIAALISWSIGILAFLFQKRLAEKIKKIFPLGLVIIGIGALAYFTIALWIHIDRPPMRTLGETRLWYSLFVPIIGLAVYFRWKYNWFMIYSLFLANVFILVNLFSPENFEKTLMPALQSIWFVPHVVVYIFSYALLAASSLVAVKGLYTIYFKEFDRNTLHLADNLVYIGFGFLTLGLLFGALWAKEAWGHYWTWDPKETWAFISWMGYLIYMHYRFRNPQNTVAPIWILSLAFVILLVCWFGINYLPTAQNSVHTYSG